MAGGVKLNRKQETAIAALLACKTFDEASRQCGLAPRTLRAWLAQPDFAAAYSDAQRLLLRTTVADLSAAMTEAVRTLRNNLAAARPADQIRAATAILEHAARGRELVDVVGRVEELERILAELQEQQRNDRAADVAASPEEQAEEQPP